VIDTQDTPWLEPPSSADDAGRDALRRQRAVVAMGRRAVALPEMSVLMHDAAALLAEMLDAPYSSVAEAAPRPGGLVLRATLGCPDDSPSGGVVQELPADPQRSLAAYTIHVAHPVVVTDLAEETRFRDSLLRSRGVVAALSVPLTLHGCSFGALAAYEERAREFTEEDVCFAETIGHLVSTAIARKRAEDSLAQQRQMAAEVLRTVDALVLVLDGEGQITHVNRAAERLTGFAADEVMRRPVWSVLPVPKEVDWYRQNIEKLQQGTAPIEFESSLLTKHGRRKRIAWSWGAVFNAQGRIESILATGIDITGRREAEEKADRAERLLGRIRPGEQATLSEGELDGMGAGAALPEPPSPVQSPSGLSGRERRQRPRRAYPYHQLIAPIVDGTLPDRGKFKHLPCHDISSGGFAFVSPGPPASDAFVVALGNPPNLTYLMSQVAHVTRIEQDGQRMYLIGCNYTGRVVP